jgi:hypothetical protein
MMKKSVMLAAGIVLLLGVAIHAQDVAVSLTDEDAAVIVQELAQQGITAQDVHMVIEAASQCSAAQFGGESSSFAAFASSILEYGNNGVSGMAELLPASGLIGSVVVAMLLVLAIKRLSSAAAVRVSRSKSCV